MTFKSFFFSLFFFLLFLLIPSTFPYKRREVSRPIGNTKLCTSCLSYGIKRIHRLEAIKVDILKKLRLTSVPKIPNSKFPDLPRLNEQIRQVDEDATVTTEDEVENKIYKINQQAPNSNSETIFFNITSFDLRHPITSVHRQIKHATLCLFIKRPIDYLQDNQKVHVMIHQPPHHHHPGHMLMKREMTYAETGQWILIDITHQVKNWINHPHLNHGFQVSCDDNLGNSLLILTPFDNDEKSYVPVLEVEFQESQRTRNKRTNSKECEVYHGNRKCCRHPLNVNFTEFGWDYILAPKVFSAYTCAGECPLFYWEGQNNYQQLTISQGNKTNNSLCCLPKMYSSLKVVYMNDQHNILVATIPGMTVEKCYCI